MCQPCTKAKRRKSEGQELIRDLVHWWRYGRQLCGGGERRNGDLVDNWTCDPNLSANSTVIHHDHCRALPRALWLGEGRIQATEQRRSILEQTVGETLEFKRA